VSAATAIRAPVASKHQPVEARRSVADFIWPWTHNWRKPTPDDRTRELIKAAAMLVAEIERRQREAAR
jgi:hypothetical protein